MNNELLKVPTTENCNVNESYFVDKATDWDPEHFMLPCYHITDHLLLHNMHVSEKKCLVEQN